MPPEHNSPTAIPEELKLTNGADLDLSTLTTDKLKKLEISQCANCTGGCEGCVISKLAKSDNFQVLQAMERLRQDPSYREFDPMDGELSFGDEASSGAEQGAKNSIAELLGKVFKETKGKKEDSTVKDAKTISKMNYLNRNLGKSEKTLAEPHKCAECKGGCPGCVISKVSGSNMAEANEIIARLREQPDYQEFDPTGGELSFADTIGAVQSVVPNDLNVNDVISQALQANRDFSQELAATQVEVTQARPESFAAAEIAEAANVAAANQSLETKSEMLEQGKTQEQNLVSSISNSGVTPDAHTEVAIEANQRVLSQFDRGTEPGQIAAISERSLSAQEVAGARTETDVDRRNRVDFDRPDVGPDGSGGGEPFNYEANAQLEAEDLQKTKDGSQERPSEGESPEFPSHSKDNDANYSSGSDLADGYIENATSNTNNGESINYRSGENDNFEVNFDRQQSAEASHDTHDETSLCVDFTPGHKDHIDGSGFSRHDSEPSNFRDRDHSPDQENHPESDHYSEKEHYSDKHHDPRSGNGPDGNDPSKDSSFEDYQFRKDYSPKESPESEHSFNVERPEKHIFEDKDLGDYKSIDVPSPTEKRFEQSPESDITYSNRQVEERESDLTSKNNQTLHVLHEDQKIFQANLVDIVHSPEANISQVTALVRYLKGDPITTSGLSLDERTESMLADMKFIDLQKYLNDSDDNRIVTNGFTQTLTNDLSQELLQVFMLAQTLKKSRTRLDELNEEELYLLRTSADKLGKANLEQLSDFEIDELIKVVKAKLIAGTIKRFAVTDSLTPETFK